MRATATAQLAEIEQKLQGAAGGARRAEGARRRGRGAEQARIAQAAAAERERLLEQTRREIEMRLRIARRELTEHAARARRRGRRGADQADDHARGSAAARRSLRGAAEGGAMTSRAAGIRYARALFDVALKERRTSSRSAAISTAFAQLVAGNEALARVLSNPAIPIARKRGVVEQLLARGGALSPIARQAPAAARRSRSARAPAGPGRGVSRAADGARATSCARKSSRRWRCRRIAWRRWSRGSRGRPDATVQLESRVDPSIIGGAVTRVGSTVYDGSVATQLQKMKQELLGE